MRKLFKRFAPKNSTLFEVKNQDITKTQIVIFLTFVSNFDSLFFSQKTLMRRKYNPIE